MAQPPDNVLTSKPSLLQAGRAKNMEAFDHLDGDTHTDVIVPYQTDKGEKRNILVQCGTGVFRFKRTCILDLGEFEVPEGLVYLRNSSRLTAESIACTFKLNLTDRISGKSAGIDLLRGKIYVNSRATGRDEQGRGKEADITSQEGIGLEAFGEYAGRESNAVMAYVFNTFNFSDEAKKDLLFLLKHTNELCDAVLVPPASTLRHCIQIRDEATQQLQEMQKTVTASGKEGVDLSFTEIELRMRDAALAIENLDVTSASTNYNEAIKLIQTLRQHGAHLGA